MAEAEERAKPKLAMWGVIVLVVALVVLLIAIVWGAGGDMEGERDEGDAEDREPPATETENPEARYQVAPEAQEINLGDIAVGQW